MLNVKNANELKKHFGMQKIKKSLAGHKFQENLMLMLLCSVPSFHSSFLLLLVFFFAFQFNTLCFSFYFIAFYLQAYNVWKLKKDENWNWKIKFLVRSLLIKSDKWVVLGFYGWAIVVKKIRMGFHCAKYFLDIKIQILRLMLSLSGMWEH